MSLFSYVPTQTFYGTFGLPNVKDVPKITHTARQRLSTPAGLPGVYSQGPLPAEKRITANGKIITTTGQTLADAVRELRAGLPIGPTQPVYIRADKTAYWPCEVESITEGPSLADQWMDFDVSFLCAGGLEYSAASSTANVTSGNSVTLTNAGTWSAAPVITVPVTAAPSGGSVTLTRGDGAYWTLKPNATGTWTIDALAETVTSPSGADGWPQMAILSQLLLLMASANTTLTLSTAGGATVGTVNIAWQTRWQ